MENELKEHVYVPHGKSSGTKLLQCLTLENIVTGVINEFIVYEKNTFCLHFLMYVTV
jgi:hypothetical protein